MYRGLGTMAFYRHSLDVLGHLIGQIAPKDPQFLPTSRSLSTNSPHPASDARSSSVAQYNRFSFRSLVLSRWEIETDVGSYLSSWVSPFDFFLPSTGPADLWIVHIHQHQNTRDRLLNHSSQNFIQYSHSINPLLFITLGDIAFLIET